METVDRRHFSTAAGIVPAGTASRLLQTLPIAIEIKYAEPAQAIHKYKKKNLEKATVHALSEQK